MFIWAENAQVVQTLRWWNSGAGVTMMAVQLVNAVRKIVALFPRINLPLAVSRDALLNARCAREAKVKHCRAGVLITRLIGEEGVQLAVAA
jgi:hypothetical protein